MINTETQQKKLIIIAGGMGPQASAYMHQMILNQVKNAEHDQEYPGIIHLSISDILSDRTNFVHTGEGQDPWIKTANIVNATMSSISKYYEKALVIVPCNTFHIKHQWKIFTDILDENIIPFNLTKKTALKISKQSDKKIAVLSTYLTWEHKLYEDYINKDLLVPASREQAEIMESIIFNHLKTSIIDTGIGETKKLVQNFYDKGVRKIILGCTEFGMIQTELEKAFSDIEFIDPMQIAAQEIIKG